MTTTTPSAVDAPNHDRAPVLQVRDLSVEFRSGDTWTRVVDGVSFDVAQGEVLGIVGESGSGKTVTSLATMGLAGDNSRTPTGEVLLEGRDLLRVSAAELSDIRGNQIAMIFQEAMRSLNPGFTVGDQIAEAVRRHRPGISRTAAWQRAVEMLELVEIPNAAVRARAYPHQLSGGMSQRVMIAMALSCDPKVLIADEPTTALDVTVQAQILNLILSLRDRIGIAVVLITHDLGVVAETCDRTVVMYAGEVVESGTTAALFARPQHPYTAGLLGAIPNPLHRNQHLESIPGRVPAPDNWPTSCRFAARCSFATSECTTAPVALEVAEPGHLARCVRHRELTLRGTGNGAAAPQTLPEAAVAEVRTRAATEDAADLLEVSTVRKTYNQRRTWRGRAVGTHPAVRDVSVAVGTGETLVVVGESGAGKSTLGRMLLRLEDPDTGSITFDGAQLEKFRSRELRDWRSQAQMIFQDPFNSLDPRMTVLASMVEPMKVHGIGTSEAAREKALALLERVGLSREHAERFPHEFSGGQLQRISIARALMTDPKLIVCDEPVAALDMSIRAQVINLLRDLQQERGISYVFITHDLSLVRVIADRVLVMYRGRVMEVAEGEALFAEPLHPYTQRLMEAVPVPDPTQRGFKNIQPLRINDAFPAQPEVGCPFARYCPSAHDRCGVETPNMIPVGTRHVACHLYDPPTA